MTYAHDENDRGADLEQFENMEITGISIDSRSIREGELFVAIRGDRFDGHDFVLNAIKQGAWGAVVERSALENRRAALGEIKNLFPVEDTLHALQEMSYMHRRKFTLPIVGITGSNGKTTTKEMLANILARRGPVLKNEGNLNNHIGVPLTLLKLEAIHKTAAIEMGMSGLGEIDLLARLVGPDVGVITNIGPAHLEFLGSMDRVAQAKGELLMNLRADGTAVLNADDAYFKQLAGYFSGRIRTFGFGPNADVRASDVRQGGEFTEFTIDADAVRADIRLHTIGNHNIYNALAAAAAGFALGMSFDEIQRGLDEFRPFAMRSEIRHIHERTVLADCYNANPGSMDAALTALVSLKTRGKAVAVLGDMLELGASAAEAHRKVGRTAAELGLDLLIAVGTNAEYLIEGAIDAGMRKDRAIPAQSNSEAAALLRRQTGSGDVVLIKGSRGMKMEKILEEF